MDPGPGHSFGPAEEKTLSRAFEKAMPIKPFYSFLAMALCASLLGACAKPRPGADVTPSGRMDILGPAPDSNPGPLPGD